MSEIKYLNKADFEALSYDKRIDLKWNIYVLYRKRPPKAISFAKLLIILVLWSSRTSTFLREVAAYHRHFRTKTKQGVGIHQ